MLALPWRLLVLTRLELHGSADGRVDDSPVISIRCWIWATPRDPSKGSLIEIMTELLGSTVWRIE